MQSILERFDASSLQFIDEAIATDPKLTRTQLAKLVCEHLDRPPRGSVKRYWSTVTLLELVRPIHLNPLRAELVQSPDEYP